MAAGRIARRACAIALTAEYERCTEQYIRSIALSSLQNDHKVTGTHE